MKKTVRERRKRPLHDKGDHPKLLILEEAWPKVTNRNVRIVHTIHEGPNMFGLWEIRKRDMPMKAEVLHTLFYYGKLRPNHYIIFDRGEILSLHKDHLVISIQVAGCEISKVLVDDGISSNLMYLTTL